jgi:hypothetical protein
VVGVFLDAQHAQQAVAELRRAGFREDQIGVVSHDRGAASTATPAADTTSSVAAGAATGAAAGAGVGALWALGIAAGVLPAIGPVIAGGLLASVLASAAGGAAVAGIVGALLGLGIPEEEAHYYEGEFRSGRTIVTVRADDRYDEAWTILHRFGAYNRTSAAAGTMDAGRATATAAAVEMGRGQTHKLNEPATGDIIRAGDEIRIPPREDVVVSKRGAEPFSGGAQPRSEEDKVEAHRP